MDRRNPDCRDANNLCHPWSLGSGDPCRNDEFFLNLMAVTRRPHKLVGLAATAGNPLAGGMRVEAFL